MRALVALLLFLVVAVPALADEPEPYVRTCSSSAFGDLGRGWQKRAVVAGPLAFVGVRDGLAASRSPHKILVVVEPHRVATVTLAVRSRPYAALGYNRISHTGSGPIPLERGTQSVRFEACRVVMSRALWNRGTQFPGYFLVSGARCVDVDISTRGKVLRRTLSFGAPCS
jgi:hypothetical protein